MTEIEVKRTGGVEGQEWVKNSEISKNFKNFAIDNLSNNDWQKPIVEFFENPTGTTDWKIKYIALSYVIIGNELFKNMPEGVLLKCLTKSEAYLAIFNAHSWSCGTH